MNLRDEIRRLAEEATNEALRCVKTGDPAARAIESAILEGVKLVLERPSSGDMNMAGHDAKEEFGTMGEIWRAMTRKLLKELE